mgnify:CR=1 FL=1
MDMLECKVKCDELGVRLIGPIDKAALLYQRAMVSEQGCVAICYLRATMC